jgi:hypothetical protein
VFAQDVRLVHFTRWERPLEELIAAWEPYGYTTDFLPSSGNVATDLVRYVREVRGDAGEDAIINVVVPETARLAGTRHYLHKLHVQRIKAALVAEAGVVVTNIVHHPGYDALEPVQPGESIVAAMTGWRHVTVVLVSAVHNATVRSIRYARSLRADEMHCIHIAVDEHEAEEVERDWAEWKIPEPLDVIASPYRQIARPVHEWVRARLDERPKTFVTIVIPEFVVAKRWHSAMHNQTPLTLKGTFLFEPSVVVSSVPYKLNR